MSEAMQQASLPIWQIHSGIVEWLRQGGRLVLVAPTGSGKTTQAPQMLLDAGLAGKKKIVVLQPRRVAARTVAARVAWELRCPLGARSATRCGSTTKPAWARASVT